MGKNLYVGNLTGNVKKSDLETIFSQFGTVQSTISSHTVTRAAAGGSASSKWTRTTRLNQRSRDSTITNMKGVV